MTKTRLTLAATALCLLIVGSDTPSQTNDRQTIKENLIDLFHQTAMEDIDGIESHLHQTVVYYDDTYPLRIEGRDDVLEFLEFRFPKVKDLDAAVRQVSIRLYGGIAVVHFYYSHAFTALEESARFVEAAEGPEEESDRPYAVESSLLGRGTAVFHKDDGWKVVSMHLSPFSHEF